MPLCSFLMLPYVTYPNSAMIFLETVMFLRNRIGHLSVSFFKRRPPWQDLKFVMCAVAASIFQLVRILIFAMLEITSIQAQSTVFDSGAREYWRRWASSSCPCRWREGCRPGNRCFPNQVGSLNHFFVWVLKMGGIIGRRDSTTWSSDWLTLEDDLKILN